MGISPHIEILNVLRQFPASDVRFKAFLSGYDLSELEFAALFPRILDYALLKSFDLVRWAIDRRPEEVEAYAEDARKMLAARSLAALAPYPSECE